MIRMTKSRRMGYAGHVAECGGRMMVKKDHKEVPCEGMEWIDVTQEQVAGCC